ncbi:MAG: hypothetical protein SFW65_10345 [Alphaproteobacteria bacterium]|nr:hypothetical protein [Alphaproteobacteria bacterium]
MAQYSYTRKTHTQGSAGSNLNIERSEVEDVGRFSTAASAQFARIFSQIESGELINIITNDLVNNDITTRSVVGYVEPHGDLAKISEIRILHRANEIEITAKNKQGKEVWSAFKDIDGTITAKGIDTAQANLMTSIALSLSDAITTAVKSNTPVAAPKATNG